jgi:hypothetical protein
MLCYMLTHDARHRGQVCMRAHQMGFLADESNVRALELGKFSERVRSNGRPPEYPILDHNAFTTFSSSSTSIGHSGQLCFQHTIKSQPRSGCL